MDTALYFPNIRPPKNSWFTQVLLYWDGAASIVPHYMRGDEQQLGPYMSQLIDANLLQMIEPESTLQENREEFDEKFLARLPKLPDPPDTWQWTPLYQEKVSQGLFEALEQRGLAQPSNSPSLKVEKRTADLYVEYLAGSFCRVNPGTFLVTDRSQTLASLTQPIDNTSARLAGLRYETIMQALPMPSQTVPPLELARFKEQERNKELLRRLRIDLNGRLIDLLGIGDEYQRQVKKEYILQAIHDDVAVLTERMSRQPWPRIILGGVAGVVAAGLAVGAVIATGGGALALGLGIGAAFAGVIPPINHTGNVIRSRQLTKREPLAYAALAGAL